jgi:hypothetical protein
MVGMRFFGVTQRPDPPAARPHEVEQAVREHLYGGRSRLDVRRRERPGALAPPRPLGAQRRVG